MSAGRRVAALLLTGLWLSGCGDYRLVRWPKRELWVRPAALVQDMTVPIGALDEDAAHPGRVERGGVAVALELIDADRARELFHADFLRRRIQPAVITIRNGGHAPYVFSKANVDRHAIPARDAGRWACVHPVVTLARHARWALFVLPGLLMGSVIEPVTTFDFPKFAELASRPPIPDCRAVRDAFASLEVADGLIAPGESRRGLLFLPPPTLGRALAVTLINTRTQEAIVFDVPMPPPVHTEARSYPYPLPTVWEAVARAADRLSSWRVTAVDPAGGVLTARTGFRLLGWNTARQVTVTVRAIDAAQTQVSLESTLRRADTTALGTLSPTIGRFFAELDTMLPAGPPPQETGAIPAGNAAPR